MKGFRHMAAGLQEEYGMEDPGDEGIVTDPNDVLIHFAASNYGDPEVSGTTMAGDAAPGGAEMAYGEGIEDIEGGGPGIDGGVGGDDLPDDVPVRIPDDPGMEEIRDTFLADMLEKDTASSAYQGSVVADNEDARMKVKRSRGGGNTY